MVYQGNDEIDYDDYPKLGSVYLMKGIASQVGEDLPDCMFLCIYRTALLPLYDMLVYDGTLTGQAMVGDNRQLREKIQAHVTKAVREQTVIYCGESARCGLWVSDPPELSPFSHAYINTPVQHEYKPSQDELKCAKLLLQYATEIGFKASSLPPSPSRDAAV